MICVLLRPEGEPAPPPRGQDAADRWRRACVTVVHAPGDGMIGSLIARVESHATEHLRFGPVPGEEIRALEARLGRLLPPALRAVLESVGNGIFFGKEELLGPRRLMIHDIELLVDMGTVKAQTPGLPETWLPFHRCDGVIHAVDLSPETFGQVHAWPGGAPRGDIGDFLAVRLR